jgi:hypothetical protein
MRHLSTAVMVAAIVGIVAGLASATTITRTVPSTKFPTIQAAVDDVKLSEVGEKTIKVLGSYNGPGAVIDKPAIKIVGNAGATINDGPLSHPGLGLRAGFLFLDTHQGNSTTIQGFTFDCNDQLVFPVFSRGADYISVISNVMNGPVQGITNWNGIGWYIKNNKIGSVRALSGGGIGIFIGSFDSGRPALFNLALGNSVTGSPVGNGGYSTPAIALMSDVTSNLSGSVMWNVILSNYCQSASESGIGIELTDLNPWQPTVSNNVVIYNNIGECAWGIALYRCSDNIIGYGLPLSQLLNYLPSGSGLQAKLQGKYADSVLLGNHVSDSRWDGVWAGSPGGRPASGNQVSANTVKKSGRDGIRMDTASENNQIIGNIVNYSGSGCDLHDLGIHNTWSGNSGTKCPIIPKRGRKNRAQPPMLSDEDLEPVVSVCPYQ